MASKQSCCFLNLLTIAKFSIFQLGKICFTTVWLVLLYIWDTLITLHFYIWDRFALSVSELPKYTVSCNTISRLSFIFLQMSDYRSHRYFLRRIYIAWVFVKFDVIFCGLIWVDDNRKIINVVKIRIDKWLQHELSNPITIF